MPKMQNHSGINKIPIDTGVKIGLLEVIYRVTLLRQHELFYDTPKSYLMQGPVWECYCHGCGNKKLISEAMLERGKLRSCGCLRARKWKESRERKVEDLKRKSNLARVSLEIKQERYRLAELRIQMPTPMRDDLMDECAAKLRNLYAQKAGLTPRVTGKKVPDHDMLYEMHKIEKEIQDVGNKLYAIIRNDDQKLQKDAYKAELKELQKKLRELARGKII